MTDHRREEAEPNAYYLDALLVDRLRQIEKRLHGDGSHLTPDGRRDLANWLSAVLMEMTPVDHPDTSDIPESDEAWFKKAKLRFRVDESALQATISATLHAHIDAACARSDYDQALARQGVAAATKRLSETLIALAECLAEVRT